MKWAIIGIFSVLLLLGCLQGNGEKQVWIDQNFLKQFKDNPVQAFDENSVTINLDSNSINLNFDINLGIADQNFVADVCSISCQYIYADEGKLAAALPGVDLADKQFPGSRYDLLKNKNTGAYGCMCTFRVCDSQQDPDFPGQLFCTDNSKKFSINATN